VKLTPIVFYRGFLPFSVAACSPDKPGATASVPAIGTTATVADLHEAMITPASDVLFNVEADPPNDDADRGQLV
jgi:hypothetical protein